MMDSRAEARIRNEVARIISEGLRLSEPADAEEVWVWEIVKAVRSSTLREVQSAVSALRIVE